MKDKAKCEEIAMEFKVELSNNDIDDIVAIALEGGITYWCDEAKVVGNYLGEYASEQISKGGQLKLYDFEEEEYHLLTREKFIEGFKKYIANPTASDIFEYVDGKLKLDTCYVDADVADAIIQYAIFGEVVYG